MPQLPTKRFTLAHPPPPYIKPPILAVPSSFATSDEIVDDFIAVTVFSSDTTSSGDTSSGNSSSSSSSSGSSSSIYSDSSSYSTSTSGTSATSSRDSTDTSQKSSSGQSTDWGSSGYPTYSSLTSSNFSSTFSSSLLSWPCKADPNHRLTMPGGPLDMTVPELLKHWADNRANHPALVFRHPNNADHRFELTYEDLYTLGTRCAALLKSRGVRREDVVVVLLPNSPERAVIETAALLLGAFAVSAVCKEPDFAELIALLEKHRASAVVLDPSLHGKEWEAIRRLCQLYDPASGLVISVRLPELSVVLHVKRRDPPNEEDFLHYLKTILHRGYSVTPAPFPFHPCVALATAGGENRPPKLVVHTHTNIVAFSKIYMPRSDSPRPSYFLSYPFDNVRGLLAVSLCNPVTRILFDEYEGPAESLPRAIFTTLTAERCTIAVMPPSVVSEVAGMYQAIPEDDPLRNSIMSKMFFVGFIGEKVSEDELESALKIGHMVLVSYVSAELLMAAMTIVSEVNQLAQQGSGQLLQPGVMIKIEDDEGNELPPEKTESSGHLLIRSPMMFKGYLNDPETTTASLATDGFFRTGDAGYVVDNYLFVEKQHVKQISGSTSDKDVIVEGQDIKQTSGSAADKDVVVEEQDV